MKKLSVYVAMILLMTQPDLHAQTRNDDDPFNYIVREEYGKLNNRQINVKVVVAMDVKADERPMRLQVFISQPKTEKLKLIVSSTKIIESMYPTEKNGRHNGGTIPDFFIENGFLQMVTDIDNRKSRYSFRFRNGNFELINILRVIWNGKNTSSETNIDLLAGTKIEFDQELGSEKIINKRQKKVKFTALPDIQNLKFSDLEKY